MGISLQTLLHDKQKKPGIQDILMIVHDYPGNLLVIPLGGSQPPQLRISFCLKNLTWRIRAGSRKLTKIPEFYKDPANTSMATCYFAPTWRLYGQAYKDVLFFCIENSNKQIPVFLRSVNDFCFTLIGPFKCSQSEQQILPDFSGTF